MKVVSQTLYMIDILVSGSYTKFQTHMWMTFLVGAWQNSCMWLTYYEWNWNQQNCIIIYRDRLEYLIGLKSKYFLGLNSDCTEQNRSNKITLTVWPSKCWVHLGTIDMNVRFGHSSGNVI